MEKQSAAQTIIYCESHRTRNEIKYFPSTMTTAPCIATESIWAPNILLNYDYRKKKKKSISISNYIMFEIWRVTLWNLWEFSDRLRDRDKRSCLTRFQCYSHGLLPGSASKPDLVDVVRLHHTNIYLHISTYIYIGQ